MTGGAPTATIVGGGPAGLMAAEVLAGAGLRVTVHEHMASVGRKFLLAGRGGLNITHTEAMPGFLDRYGAAADRLASGLESFGPDALRQWCADLGEPSVVGSSGRVFPASFRATPLLRAWLGRLRAQGVEFSLRSRWDGFEEADTGPASPSSWFVGADGSTARVDADVTILALGGASWPRVGSTGAWPSKLEERGVRVAALTAANCGVLVEWSERFTDRHAGTPLKNVAVSVGDTAVGDTDARDRATPPVRGDLMITRTGLEGGPVYAVGPLVRERLGGSGGAVLLVDLQPDLGVAALRARLDQRRRPKDSTTTWLKRCGLAPAHIDLVREATGNDIPRDASLLAPLLKAVPLGVRSLMAIDRAISTAGGVTFDELDDALMTRRMPGVFVAGEMIDWEAPTGGYLLQATFSTAMTAAHGAVRWLSGQ